MVSIDASIDCAEDFCMTIDNKDQKFWFSGIILDKEWNLYDSVNVLSIIKHHQNREHPDNYSLTNYDDIFSEQKSIFKELYDLYDNQELQEIPDKNTSWFGERYEADDEDIVYCISAIIGSITYGLLINSTKRLHYLTAVMRTVKGIQDICEKKFNPIDIMELAIRNNIISGDVKPYDKLSNICDIEIGNKILTELLPVKSISGDVSQFKLVLAACDVRDGDIINLINNNVFKYLNNHIMSDVIEDNSFEDNKNKSAVILNIDKKSSSFIFDENNNCWHIQFGELELKWVKNYLGMKYIQTLLQNRGKLIHCP